ncbi:MAG TPA: NAD-dependent epimerase/dehydratase family protein [Devosia sp.]|nr:NAD-dependent epimerase/dehydratase family protein [Devosia sp.]
MARVAVTGSGGFIGAYLTRRLVEDDHEVLALDNFLRGRPERLADLENRAQVVNADVRDKGDRCLGHRKAPARVPAFRRLCRRPGVPAQKLF